LSFPAICWRNGKTGERITGIDLSCVEGEEDRMVVLPLSEVLGVLIREIGEKWGEWVEVRWSHRVVDVRQDERGAWVDVLVGEEEREERFEADYVVGCDGGQSTVRKCLFGRNWPGETFQGRLLVQNVRLPY
jgi:2-polyprenyl-6-methoxyphenol hydroxylase-like FAD-dependent oxidoreductase